MYVGLRERDVDINHEISRRVTCENRVLRNSTDMFCKKLKKYLQSFYFKCFLFQDCHGPEFDDKVVADDVQDYELISAYQNKTHTCVEFRRPLDTCDKQDFVIGVSY